MIQRHQVVDCSMATAVILVPLAFAPARYGRPEPWIVFLAMCVILLSQPAINPKEMVDRAAADRRSSLAIYAAQIAAQLAAVLGFGYGRGPAPSLTSPIV